ncbi:helix-turn-helix domain-containing protein [Ensifer sp. Root31]|uniref:helix-turn-helix domain-containing protein n=1 Tax=Ensifer sp. Root31 TaxID=1736512 RepID=UPI0032992636
MKGFSYVLYRSRRPKRIFIRDGPSSQDGRVDGRAGCCSEARAGRRARRAKCHVRQIAMYVCHVVLQISQGDIANAFERDRTTVRHACSVIEDRRDAADFDAFIETIERLVSSAFTAQAERGE